MVTVKHKKTRMTCINDVVLVFLLLILNIFHTFFSAFFVDFDEVNISWVRILLVLTDYGSMALCDPERLATISNSHGLTISCCTVLVTTVCSTILVTKLQQNTL